MKVGYFPFAGSVHVLFMFISKKRRKKLKKKNTENKAKIEMERTTTVVINFWRTHTQFFCLAMREPKRQTTLHCT